MAKRNKRLIKHMTEKRHAQTRFSQRFGKALPPAEYKRAVESIQSNKFECIARQSCRVTIWRGEVMDTDVVMVYDNNRGKIVTFLSFHDSLCCPHLMTIACENKHHRHFVCNISNTPISNNQVIDCCMLLWWRSCLLLTDEDNV